MSIRDELIRIVEDADADIDERPFPDRIVDAILCRYAVVELPEPDFHGCWPAGGGTRVMLNVDGKITNGYAIRETPAEARALAAALLAAANRAESQQ
ncbi:hypothetical protein ACWDTG_06885 [Rhodococcus zopfii]